MLRGVRRRQRVRRQVATVGRAATTIVPGSTPGCGMAMTNIPEILDAKRVPVGPGDVVVLRTRGPLSERVLHQIREAAAKAFAPARTVVIDEAFDVDVFTPAPAPDAMRCPTCRAEVVPADLAGLFDCLRCGRRDLTFRQVGG